MRLCLIYNVWSDWDLLEISLKTMINVVDGVIVVGSEKSNYGEVSEIPEQWRGNYLHVREPKFNHPQHSETDKRNYGLKLAVDQGYTHFICLDADEIYDPVDILEAKQKLIDNETISGLVCRTRVYFKSPTLTIGYDTTLVPFIQKITPGLKHEFNRSYPFAWKGKNLMIDPTRSTSAISGIEWSDVIMEHFSWVRTDYEKKIRNSTARANLTRSSIVHDLVNAKEGEMCHFYGKRLLRVANRFNIPEYGEEGIRTLAENIQLQQSLAAADKAPQSKRG